MIIGHVGDNYNIKRNIINIVKDNHYKKIYDINRIMIYLLYNLKHYFPKSENIYYQAYKNLLGTFDDICCISKKVDIIHFFNIINYGNIPWITTFETVLPRIYSTMKCHHGREINYLCLQNDSVFKKALDILSGKSCKKLIAMSNCSFNMQNTLLSSYPNYKSEIMDKTIVLNPPQKILIKSYSEKKVNINAKIKFIFVGRDFFRKGGREIINVLSYLKKQKYDIHLTIVSNIQPDQYVTYTSQDDVNYIKSIISSNSDWISHYNSLSNIDTLCLIKGSHIGLLPTYADTYGYSVLEYQASGCPVISTDVRALPEINTSQNGWIIPIPKNSLGEALYSTNEEREEISNIITNNLLAIIQNIYEDKGVIITKAENCINRINNEHSIEDYALKLSNIYKEALCH